MSVFKVENVNLKLSKIALVRQWTKQSTLRCIYYRFCNDLKIIHGKWCSKEFMKISP